MAGFVSNLVAALGGEGEGPDPNKLDGLQECARQFLDGGEFSREEIEGYFHTMRERIQEAHRDRHGALEGRRAQLDTGLVELIESNLAAYVRVDAALEAFLEALDQDEDACRAALEGLGEAAGQLRETSARIAELSGGSVALCPRCGSAGPEPLCPACAVDRLIPDPDFAHEEFEQAVVSQEVKAVFDAYVEVVEGRAPLATLSSALQSLEFSLLEAQALAEQALEENPEHPGQQQLVQAVNGALEGVNRMHAVTENRSTRELNQGWIQVFRGAVMSTALLAQMAEG